MHIGWPIHEGMKNIGIARLMIAVQPLDTIQNLAAGGMYVIAINLSGTAVVIVCDDWPIWNPYF